jgi:hypothetical protein
MLLLKAAQAKATQYLCIGGSKLCEIFFSDGYSPLAKLILCHEVLMAPTLRAAANVLIPTHSICFASFPRTAHQHQIYIRCFFVLLYPFSNRCASAR